MTATQARERTSAKLSNPAREDANLRSGPQMREYRAIARTIAADRPGKVLDWGAGWGQLSQLLRNAGLEAVAFDHYAGTETVRTQRLERFPEIEVTITGDPWRLPFEDGSFDAALSCGVLEHVEHPEASLGELRRVLRPRGTLYVYKLPNRLSYLELIARALRMYHHGTGPHDRLYTLSSAREMVSGNGFEVRSARRANMLPLTVPVPGRLAPGAIWALNRGLSRIPGLNLFATNLELVATRV